MGYTNAGGDYPAPISSDLYDDEFECDDETVNLLHKEKVYISYLIFMMLLHWNICEADALYDREK